MSAAAAATRDAPPPGVRRLFPGYASAALGDLGLVAERLLEDGDRADLRWLFTRYGEAAVRDWFVTRGARRLSARSCRFWSTVLDAPLGDGDRAAVASALWSL